VTVGADLGIGVKIVQDAEPLRQRMQVRRYGLGKKDQLRVVIAERLIAEDLVVGAVLLDDVDHMLDG
jgi:hypothetical protein